MFRFVAVAVSAKFVFDRDVLLAGNECNRTAALERTRERARRVAAFLPNVSSEIFADYRPQTGQVGGWVDGGKDFEVNTCPHLRVGFVHIYKAAGTTGKALLEAGCPELRHHYSCCGCDDEPTPNVCHKKTTTLMDGSNDVHWEKDVDVAFTFVRDPVDRFQSGLFELALRGDARVSDWLARSRKLGRTLADIAIDDLLKDNPRRTPNPHLMMQLSFLSSERKPLPGLKHVALMGPDFKCELVALSDELFHLHPSFVVKMPQYRNAHFGGYNHGLASVRDEPLPPDVVKKIERYYRADYAAFGIKPHHHRY